MVGSQRGWGMMQGLIRSRMAMSAKGAKGGSAPSSNFAFARHRIKQPMWDAMGACMQGRTYTLIGIFAAEGLAALFVTILRVGLT